VSDIESRILEYLLNSLWQVPVIFAAGWIAVRMARRIGPQMEHRVWVSALMLEAALPACRFRLEGLLREMGGLVLRGAGTGSGGVQVVLGAGAISRAGMLRMPRGMLEEVAVAYGCGLMYFAGRLGWGLWRTYVMTKQAECVTLTGEAMRHWERYAKIFGCESARVGVSAMVAGPATVGGRQGVMLVPPGFLESVTEADLDAVVSHEFAHMRRRDFLKNLVYGALSLPVAYHPLLWMTRARVAESREMVCDAMAAEAVEGRENYARSLLRLASLLVKCPPVKTLHAIGIFDANIFERRVMKLTQGRVEIRGARQFAMAAACVVVGLATCASALALRMDVAAPVAASAPQSESSARMTVPAQEMEAVYRKNPVYPVKARASKDTLDGPVVLAVTVSEDGMPTEVHVTKSLRPDYDESALVAVREWRWHPYLLNGNPVAVDTTVTVNYSPAR
jgi:TonB family protein